MAGIWPLYQDTHVYFILGAVIVSSFVGGRSCNEEQLRSSEKHIHSKIVRVLRARHF